MTRQEFPSKVKVAAYKRSNHHCELCTAPLRPGKFRFDHVIPDQMGGEPTLENCQVICLNCDSAKTYGKDLPEIASAKRKEARHIGAHRSSRPMAGGRNSPWKVKIGGQVVPRHPKETTP